MRVIICAGVASSTLFSVRFTRSGVRTKTAYKYTVFGVADVRVGGCEELTICSGGNLLFNKV